MTMRATNRNWRLLLFGAIALLASSGSAAAQGSKLYEVTENMSIGPGGDGLISRLATAALQGSAELGTPWCPYAFLLTSPKAKTCTITAVGHDDVDLVPFLDPPANTVPNPNFGKGTVTAEWATVVQGDNPVDAPEYVLLTGSFTGDIDLSLAVKSIAPLGSLTGSLTVKGNPALGIPASSRDLTGTFRLPFGRDASGKPQRPRKGVEAFYLGDDFRPFPVKNHERSLGAPTVRLDLLFQ